MTFRVGQKVVCVNDKRCVSIKRGGWFARFRSFLRLDHNLNRDHVYRVTHVCVLRADCGADMEMIRVDKARNFEAPEIGFPSFQFRPLIERETKTDISIFTTILDRENRQLPDRVIATNDQHANVSPEPKQNDPHTQ